MEARYLQKGDVIIIGVKRYTVNSVKIKSGKVIAETSGGRLTFNAGEQVTLD